MEVKALGTPIILLLIINRLGELRGVSLEKGKLQGDLKKQCSV